jgi:hypothetical protein
MENISLNMLAILLILLGIGFFIIIREFFLWYFKINKRVKLAEEQNFLLKHILLKLGATVLDLEKALNEFKKHKGNIKT